jgi:hypothetical protein
VVVLGSRCVYLLFGNGVQDSAMACILLKAKMWKTERAESKLPVDQSNRTEMQGISLQTVSYSVTGVVLSNLDVGPALSGTDNRVGGQAVKSKASGANDDHLRNFGKAWDFV